MKKHNTDTISLAFGLAFLAFAAWWQLGLSADLDLPKFGWLAGGALILLGALGVLATLRPEQGGHRDHVEQPGPPPVATTTDQGPASS